MKKGLWTVVFMVLITAVFIAGLSSVNEFTRDKILQNARIENFKAILYAFNIFPGNQTESDYSLKATTSDIDWIPEEIIKTVKNEIIKIKVPVTPEQSQMLKASYLTFKDSLELFLRVKNDSVLGIGFPMKGKGLWGTITAFGVVSPDLTKMIGIDFTEQVETPGLGARILEIDFKRFFRCLDLSGFQSMDSGKPAVVMVGRKEKTNIEQSTNELQAITGATQTCNGVVNMINTDLQFYLEVIRSNFDLIKKKVKKMA